MADLPNLLLASLNPATRKQAESSLNAYSTQQGFLSHLLRLVVDQSQDRAVRQAGSIYLKNIAKLRWEEDEQPIVETDKASLRSELVPAMIALSRPEDKAIRVQVAESVSLIAELDFPEKWPSLIDQLVQSLSPTDYNVNTGVLQTAHSIFKQWRAHVRSDELFTEINLVFSKFMTPFLQLFRQTAQICLEKVNINSVQEYNLAAQSMALLIEIYHDFTCQDIPPAIEDSHMEFFATPQGWFPRLMSWNPPELKTDPDEPTPSLPSAIKTAILEIVELFVKLYPEQLTLSKGVETFVSGVWSLIGSNQLPGIADDSLVSQSLRFISTAIRSGLYKDLFSAGSTISSLVEGVVVPNVSLREHDVEQFEDDPLEFIRLDLAVSTVGTDAATRRQAAADVLQALVGSGHEGETTSIVGQWINKGLSEYASNKSENWKSKDSAVYMLTALATRGGTSAQGVTSTNALVDVVKFFGENVFEDLQAPAGSVHPILQVDAIRFLVTFRNQLTKTQLLSVLPLLAGHLRSDNYVTYTYAAITIDRVLAIKQNNQLLFSQADVRDSAADLLNALLSKLESANTPQKLAENDHLMKCIMRVIATARQSLTPVYQGVLQRLVAILATISQNPSNPKFDQYIFESMSILMRFVAGTSRDTIPTFEQLLFPQFTNIIQNDIDQYVPYVFQIIAQMLELQPSSPSASMPDQYRSLLPFLLTPAVWQQKGSVPGLVKLLKAYLSRDAPQMVAQGQIGAVLGVCQQRLIPSKQNDVWGIELLMAVVSNVPVESLSNFFKGVILSMLTRMQASKTDNFVFLFAKFLLFVMAINVNGLGPDYVIGTIEGIQPGLWSQILNNFILPQIPKTPYKDRKLAVVGVTRLLFQSKMSIQPPQVQSWPAVMTSLIKLFSEPQYLASQKTDEDSQFVGLTEIDYEEQTAGYQAAYSRLAGSSSAEVDPVEYVSDPQAYLGQEMVRFFREQGQGAKELLAKGDPSVLQPFMTSMAAAGYEL
ncbi:importin alpha re-exporter [Dendrothele bispora CBS 962.96]|uniref:Importin alpha re-exporter n=1 Tax=Dendrothele bispora (strain CBS 962.96) TaxID=1314807 RepID=A0A4V4HHY8_DENBC|nr:importin alpha re-exporter [Dendrothele bispora CBS 962.96]